MPVIAPQIKAVNATLLISEARLVIPRIGNWTLDCTVNDPLMPLDSVPMGVPPVVGGPAAIILDSNAMLGTVVSSLTGEQGLLKLRICGGLTGGYPKPITVPLNIAIGPTAAVAATTFLGASGEAFSIPLSNPAMANTLLKGYQTFGGTTAANCMTRLAQSLGCGWRVDLLTSMAYLSVDPFLVPATLPTMATVSHAEEGVGVTYECPTLDQPIPLPGTVDPNTLLPINEVVVEVTPEKTTVSLYNVQASSWLPAPSNVPASGLYAGTILTPNPDATYTFKPDLATAVGPAFARCAVRCGLPGVTLKIPPSSRAIVDFDNADPTSLPAIVAFDSSALGLPGMVTIGPPAASAVVNNAPLVAAYFAQVHTWMTALSVWVLTGVAPPGGGPVTYAAPAPTPPTPPPLVVSTMLATN
jgi:hypothetical protein